MEIKIVSPERLFEKTEVEFVELRTVLGYVGIGKGHAPALFELAPGVLTAYKGPQGQGKLDSYFVARGVCHVTAEGVAVLAETVEPKSIIDEKRAEDSHRRAKERLEEKEAQTNVDRALASLERAGIRKRLVSESS